MQDPENHPSIILTRGLSIRAIQRGLDSAAGSELKKQGKEKKPDANRVSLVFPG